MGRLVSCMRKMRFANKAAATAMAVHRLSKRDSPVKYLRPYLCRHCNGWHLTSQKPNQPED